MKNLFIDVGHSTKFPGANGTQYGGRQEIVWNRLILKNLLSKINAQKWHVIQVPTDFLTDWSSNRQLINRISWINRQGGPYDHLLSIHANAAASSTPRGVTTIYCGGYESMAVEARKLTDAVCSAAGLPMFGSGAEDDRRERFGRVGMVRDTEPIALLLEAGFCTNKDDMSVPQEKVAQGIANYYNAL